VSTAVEGTNDRYLANAAAGCAPFTTAMPSSDTLTVRHSTVTTATAAGITGTGPLYVCSTLTSATLVNTTTACTLQTITQATVPTVTMKGGIYNLVVNTYYVNQDAATTPGLPTLYRQTLSNTSGAAPSIVNTEILPGVEDLQVQFGIDPTGTTGVASQYVDAVTAQQLSAGAATAVAQVVSVRIWLLLRADQAEPTFTDSNTYQYANRTTANGTVTTLTASNAGKAYAPADHYRRLLVSRTIMLRNALGT
jgi:hypothetical protein